MFRSSNLTGAHSRKVPLGWSTPSSFRWEVCPTQKSRQIKQTHTIESGAQGAAWSSSKHYSQRFHQVLFEDVQDTLEVLPSNNRL